MTTTTTTTSTTTVTTTTTLAPTCPPASPGPWISPTEPEPRGDMEIAPGPRAVWKQRPWGSE